MRIRATYLVMIAVGGLCAYLAYRLTDANVTLEYAQGELKRAHIEIDVVSRFQRAPCNTLDSRIDGVRFYKKNDMYVADGVEFVCKHQGASSYLLRKNE
jgi:hypothetical protein